MNFASLTVTAILIQTTCVARMLCRFPCLSHVRPSHLSPMTSTLKTRLMRPRQEPKRCFCYQLEKHWKISEVKNPWTIGWHGGSVKGDCRLCNQLGVQPLLSAQDDRVAAVAQGASQRPQNAQRSMARHALIWVPSPTSVWADISLWSPFDARCVCVHASAILADPRARVAACV